VLQINENFGVRNVKPCLIPPCDCKLYPFTCNKSYIYCLYYNQKKVMVYVKNATLPYDYLSCAKFNGNLWVKNATYILTPMDAMRKYWNIRQIIGKIEYSLLQ